MILTVVLVILGILVVGAGVAFGYMHYLNTKLSKGVDSSFKSSLSDNATAAGDPFYALLLGTDEDENRVSGTEAAEYGAGNYRSDSIILARIDPKNKLITLISMHRDTMVDLSAYGGTGQDKLNAAYHYGGPQLVVSQVEQLAGVKISHYAEVNIDGLADITNTLGGVEVDVPMTFYDDELEGGLNAGVQTLYGDDALLFCRARHAYDAIGDGDVYRAKNQRIFLTAIAKKVLSSDASTIIQTVNTTVNYIKTDMSVGDIASLATQLQGMDTSTGIYSAMCPTTSELVNGIYYEVINQSAWKTMMARVDAGQPPTDTTTTSSSSTTTTAASSTTSSSTGTILVKNGTARSGIASEAASKLQAAGYSTETGNADTETYATTLVIYNSAGNATEANKIASALGKGTVMANDGSYSSTSNYLVVVGSDW